jgi:TrmH family RNA methyltransferase
MLSKSQEKLIRSLHNKKGREKHGLCLVEGKKVIDMAKDFVVYTFGKDNSKKFKDLVTTDTPQNQAAVAKIPSYSIEDIKKHSVILVLDGIQDPGNLGSILRLCLGFDASLVLVETADPTNPKVIRSSVGAMFQVPWIEISRIEADEFIKSLSRPVYRLERLEKSNNIRKTEFENKIILIAGSEGQGIKLPIEGKSIAINHSNKLESLNVAHAIAIFLFFKNESLSKKLFK